MEKPASPKEPLKLFMMGRVEARHQHTKGDAKSTSETESEEILNSLRRSIRAAVGDSSGWHRRA